MAHEFTAPVVIHMPYGRIIIGDDISKNGIRVISDVPDPPELVFEARHGGGLGKVSFARHRADGNREEVVLLQGKIDERYRSVEEGGHAAHTELVGEWRMDTRVPESVGGDEGGMAPAHQIAYDGHRSHVPVTAPSLGASGAATGPVTRFYTDHREFCVNWQDDGEGLPRGIVYDTHGSADEATWTAVGQIPIVPL